MLDVAVKRSEWYRGHGGTGSGLLIDHDQVGQGAAAKCCLGFVCEAAGIPTHELHGKLMPAALFMSLDEYPASLHPLIQMGAARGWLAGSSELANRMAAVNDDNHYTSEVERETELINLAKEGDINLSFVD